MKVNAYSSPEVFDALGAEWNELLLRSATNVLFLTREWQRTWWRELGDGDLCVVTLRDDAGVLQGIAPLFIYPTDSGRTGMSFVGCKEVSDYLDFVFARDHEETCYQALVDFLASADSPSWQVLSLCNIPETSPTFAQFDRLAQTRGWQVEKRFEDVAPIIKLPGTFDEYLAGLEGKERRELQRKLRRAGNEVHITFATDSGRLEQDMEDFLRLMVASMPTKATFMTPRMRQFFHAIARAMFDAGWLQLSFLDVHGERAASYMNFIYGDTVLVYNSGLDPYRYAALSPGQVLLGRLIEQAIGDGHRAFDFLQGNEEYKHKLGGKDLNLYTLTISR